MNISHFKLTILFIFLHLFWLLLQYFSLNLYNFYRVALCSSSSIIRVAWSCTTSIQQQYAYADLRTDEADSYALIQQQPPKLIDNQCFRQCRIDCFPKCRNIEIREIFLYPMSYRYVTFSYSIFILLFVFY
jgi:hypothetical protein